MELGHAISQHHSLHTLRTHVEQLHTQASTQPSDATPTYSINKLLLTQLVVNPMDELMLIYDVVRHTGHPNYLQTQAMNSGVPKGTYQGEPLQISLPTL